MDASGWRIKDFQTEISGDIYLLETNDENGDTYNYLRKLSPNGDLLWRRRGPFSSVKDNIERMEGNFGQLLMDEKNNPYLPATRHRGFVARIQTDDGNLIPYANWGHWIGEVFMDGYGVIYYVRYLPKKNRRAWTRYDPSTNKEKSIIYDEEFYGLMAMPVAVDNKGRGYCVCGMSMGCLARGSLAWYQVIDNIVIDVKSLRSI